MKDKVTTNTTGIPRIRYCCEQLYANKLENLEEMNKFLETYNFLRLNQEELENINRPITSNEIHTVIKNLSTKSSTRWLHR